jgi:hypothetical protein
MASRKISLTGRRLLTRLNTSSSNRHVAGRAFLPSSPSFSTVSTADLNDPSTFVQGTTVEDLENNPVLAEYFAANFPKYGTGGADDSGISTQTIQEEAQKEEDEGEQITSSPLNIRTLSGFTRSVSGSQPCYRLREREQLIPGLIYGSDPTQNILSKDPSSRISVMTPWQQIQREMDLFTYHNFESRVYDLTVYDENDEEDEGVVHRVVPANVQFHPIQNKIYCCNFLRYHPGKPIKIPIVYVNEDESGAMKRGGFIVPQNRHVSCLVEDGVPIPEAIEMDCTGLKLKEVIRLDRMIFPPGVKASKKVDPEKFLVGTLFGRRADGGDEDETSEETAEE